MDPDGTPRTLGTMPIDQFLDLLASPSPTPGGGGIAALAGALAAGLISMVSNLTVGKEKYAGVQEEVKSLLAESENLRRELLQLVDADAQAFNQIMEGYRLPKATEEEKRIRSARIQEATLEASRVPLEIARKCARIVELAGPAARIINVQAIGDVAMAAYLAEGAVRGAVINIDINLRSVKDQEAVAQLNGQAQALLPDLQEKVNGAVRDGLARL
ncbi:MAG: cyclodeaminase/cyclohydrolase family protein [Chloroflexota bacterium]